MSARRIIRGSASTPIPLVAAAALAAALGLAACGVKSSPQHPEGSAYPREYPAPGDGKAAPADKAKEGGVAPWGTPYDYPNRPPSR